MPSSPSNPLEVSVLATRDSIGALDTTQLLYLLVELRPPSIQSSTHLPLNLCLVIDRSTSMRGDRLDRVKTAASLVIETLGAKDVISIVTFSDRAEVVLPASYIQHKATLIAQVHSIIASGGTEIYQGLTAGVRELRKAALNHHTNHLILLTDGHTYGDDDACLRMATDIAVEGIGVSAFGIGADWNDHFLDRLVSPSGGQSAYIEQPSQIIDYLRNRINGLGAVYAHNLRLMADYPMGVNLKYGLKIAPYAQPLSLDSKLVKLGALEGQLPLSFLLEFIIEPQLPGRQLTLPVTLMANIPSHHLHDHTIRREHRLTVTAQDEALVPPSPLVDAVRVLNLYRMNEQVWDEVEAGQLQAATERLRRLTTRLLESGHSRLAQQAYAETERLATMGTLSLEGRKKLKYGTRSLLSRTINFNHD
jgi:Ca-activated chloride channel family protein